MPRDTNKHGIYDKEKDLGSAVEQVRMERDGVGEADLTRGQIMHGFVGYRKVFGFISEGEELKGLKRGNKTWFTFGVHNCCVKNHL